MLCTSEVYFVTLLFLLDGIFLKGVLTVTLVIIIIIIIILRLT